jgi:hypothetical protein
MLAKNNIQETADLIQQDFEYMPKDLEFLTEEDLLEALANHVEDMLKYKSEILMSNLYRLDVSEKKVAFAMSPEAALPPNIGIANLIIERQKQRVFTKNHYKTKPLDNWFLD